MTITCQFDDCHLIYEKPILLPCCGETICEKHVDSLRIDGDSNKYKCTFCDQEFSRPDRGFLVSKAIERLIKDPNMGEQHRKAKESMVLLENNLEQLSKSIKLSSLNIFSHFDGIINEIDLKRERFKAFIDNYYDELIKNVNDKRNSCEQNPNLDKLIQTFTTEEEKYKSQVEEIRDQLRFFSLDPEYWTDLRDIMIETDNKLKQKLTELNESIMMNKTYKFSSSSDDFEKVVNKDILGKFLVEDIKTRTRSSKIQNSPIN